MKTNICKIKCLTNYSEEYAFYDRETSEGRTFPTISDASSIIQCEGYTDVFDKQSCQEQIRAEEEDINGDSGISSGSGSTDSAPFNKNINQLTGLYEDLTKVPWFMGPLLR